MSGTRHRCSNNYLIPRKERTSNRVAGSHNPGNYRWQGVKIVELAKCGLRES
jgi:hypothetical protein